MTQDSILLLLLFVFGVISVVLFILLYAMGYTLRMLLSIIAGTICEVLALYVSNTLNSIMGMILSTSIAVLIHLSIIALFVISFLEEHAEDLIDDTHIPNYMLRMLKEHVHYMTYPRMIMTSIRWSFQTALVHLSLRSGRCHNPIIMTPRESGIGKDMRMIAMTIPSTN